MSYVGEQAFLGIKTELPEAETEMMVARGRGDWGKGRCWSRIQTLSYKVK